MEYEMFIGRWQPFHQGHKKLIETVLNEGKNALIAIRDTKISDKNPYSAEERYQMIYEAMKDWGNRVRIITIPDIKNVIYGRDVGWGIREIRLDEQTESISATKIRMEISNI